MDKKEIDVLAGVHFKRITGAYDLLYYAGIIIQAVVNGDVDIGRRRAVEGRVWDDAVLWCAKLDEWLK